MRALPIIWKRTRNTLTYLDANVDAYKQVQALPFLANGAETVRQYFSFASDVGEGWMQQRVLRMLNGGT